MARLKPSEHKGKQILDDEELRSLWHACDEAFAFGPLVKMLLLTAQRREKVASMQWDDLKDGVWTIAKEAREKANAGSLKLPDMALAIIDAQPRLAGNPHVFAARGKGAFNSWSQRKDELDAKVVEQRRTDDRNAGPLPHWTVHDLRRTARSLMARAGVRPDIAERVLGHAIAGVEGVYDRHGYDDEKAKALEALASLVERIINPSANVVTLAEAAR